MASDEEIKTLAVKIALDASSFTQQAQEFKKQVSSLDSGFKASVAGIKDWGTQSTHLKDQVKALGQQIDVQKQVISSYQAQITKTNTALETHAKQLVANRDNVTKLKAEYDQSTTTLGKNAEATKNLKKQLDDAEQALSKSENQVRRNQSAIDGYNIQLNNATGKLNTMEAALKNANSALFDHTNALAKAGSGLQSAGDKITSAGSKISGIGTTLTAAVTAPVVGLGVAAEKTGIDFEAQMSRVQAISGATASQLKDLTQTAMDLGAKTTYSDQEVAEGMENMAAAGFSVNEVTAAMPGMLNLAASSGEDLASSAEIASTTLRGFGLAADQAGHVADVLAKNAADTNANVADTGLAMQYIAPLAQNAGWSLESVTAAIGEMSDKGIKGEKAGTALRGALSNLINPSKEQAAAMKEVGLQVYNSQGKMNSLSNIIEQLQKGTAKMTDAQRDNAVATIMGTDAMSGMQALISDGSGALDTMTASLKSSDGAAQDMANTMLNNTKGSIEQMKGSVENAGIALSKILSPTVRDVADKATELANKFANSTDATKKQTVQYALLAAAVGPVLLGTGKVVESIGSSVKVFGKGVSGVANFVKGLAGIAPAAGEAIPVMQKLGLAIAANPYAALAVAIGAVVTAIGVMTVKTLNAKKPVDDYIQSLKNEDKTWQDLKKAANDKAATDLAELDNIQDMVNQLNGLVDANGKVIGSKETAKELVDIINSTTGKNELQMINDQIVGWNNARDSINKYIEAKKAQALIDANQGAYTSALKNIKDANASIGQQQLNIQKQKKTVKDLEDTLEKELDNGNTYDFILAARIENEKKRLDSMQTQYGEHAKTISGYRETITNMNDAIAANAEGNYSKVEAALNRATITYTAATGATKQQLLEQVQAAKKSLDQVLSDRQTGNKNITDVEIYYAKDRYNKAAVEYDKEVGQAGAAAAAIGQSYAGGLNSTAGAASAAGANLGNSAISGADSVSTYGIGQKKADEFGVGMASHNSAAYSAGYSAGERAKQGMADSLSGVNELFNEKLAYYYGNARAARLEGRAIGDTNWRGGLLRINEEGGEIVNLPQHTQIIPHDISMEIAKAVGGAVKNGGKNQFNVAVNIYGSATASDGKAIATVVSNVIARQVNARR